MAVRGAWHLHSSCADGFCHPSGGRELFSTANAKGNGGGGGPVWDRRFVFGGARRVLHAGHALSVALWGAGKFGNDVGLGRVSVPLAPLRGPRGRRRRTGERAAGARTSGGRGRTRSRKGARASPAERGRGRRASAVTGAPQ